MADDLTPVILEQLRFIPQMAEQLKGISAGLARLESHDEEQAHLIADLKMNDHQFTAALTVLTSELKTVARDVEAVKQEVMPLNTFIQKVNTVSLRVNKIDDIEKEVGEWRPWIRVLKWAATLAGTALVLAVVYAIFWAVQQSGALVR